MRFETRCLLCRRAVTERRIWGISVETGKGPVVWFGREIEGKRKDGSVFPADLEVTKMEVGGQIKVKAFEF